MSEAFSYICPHCGGEMTYIPEHSGMNSQCPNCQKGIVLGGVVAKRVRLKASKLVWVFSIVVLSLLSFSCYKVAWNILYDGRSGKGNDADNSEKLFFWAFAFLFSFLVTLFLHYILREFLVALETSKNKKVFLAQVSENSMRYFGLAFSGGLLCALFYSFATGSNIFFSSLYSMAVAFIATCIFIISPLKFQIESWIETPYQKPNTSTGSLASLGGITGLIMGIILFGHALKNVPNVTRSEHTPEPSYSEANRGYMTRDDDAKLTSISLKKGMGESIAKTEQNFLDEASAGKFGKPFGDRPDKDHDTPDPLK